MSLKAAFNMLTSMHSRAATLRRPGNPDLYSPCRITPSNYFRFLRGPEATTIPGKEFIIPVSTLWGSFSQVMYFSEIPMSGSFKLKYGIYLTGFMNSSATSSAIQTQLRLIEGLENVTVSGNFSIGFLITFNGFQNTPIILSVEDSTLEDDDDELVSSTVIHSYSQWSDKISRGDKLVETVDNSTRSYTIDEIIEVVDFGGSIMGYRCRCDA